MIKKITLGSILFLLIGCIGFFSSYADLSKALTSQDYVGLFDLREDQDTHQTWAKHQSGVEGLSRGLISYIDPSLSANTISEVRLHEFIQEWHPLSNQASAYTLEVLAEVFQHMAHLIQEEGSANKNRKPQKTKKEVLESEMQGATSYFLRRIEKDIQFFQKQQGNPSNKVYVAAQVERAVWLMKESYMREIKAIAEERDLNEGYVKEVYFKSYAYILNRKNDFRPYEQSIHFKLETQQGLFTSTITPAKFINDILTESYTKDGIYGVSSMDHAQKHHAVNLGETEYRLGEDILFRSLRMGVLSATGIEDTKEREKANLSRGREVLQGLVTMRLQNAFEADNQADDLLEKAQAGEPIAIQTASISLLTPDRTRSWVATLDRWYNRVAHKFTLLEYLSLYEGERYYKNERQQLLDQVKVWDSFEKEAQKVDIIWNGKRYKDIPVKVQVMKFNWCVQGKSLRTFLGVPVRYAPWSGWDVADQLNEPSLKMLLGNLDPKLPLGGQVANYIEGKDLSKNDKARIIKDLGEQIRRIWSTRSYMQIEDPYKMAVRVLALTYLLGYETVFNCMSGKDRTGMLDLEIKFLMSYIFLTNRVPEPNMLFTDNEKGIYTALAIYSGNLDVQRFNTSIGGSKTYFGKQDPLLPKFINKTAREWHMGGWCVFKEHQSRDEE